jgi:hypothetical protein
VKKLIVDINTNPGIEIFVYHIIEERPVWRDFFRIAFGIKQFAVS